MEQLVGQRCQGLLAVQDPQHFNQFVSHLARGSGWLVDHKERHQQCIIQVIAQVRLDGVRFLLLVVRPYYPEFELHPLDITGPPGFAVEVVVPHHEQ
jgi:hypothetical protein